MRKVLLLILLLAGASSCTRPAPVEPVGACVIGDSPTGACAIGGN